MELIGFIVCIVIAIWLTCIPIVLNYAYLGLTGKFNKWIFLFWVPALGVWYYLYVNVPISVIFN